MPTLGPAKMISFNALIIPILRISYGIMGQVWYLIVTIPDLCTLTYFAQTLTFFALLDYPIHIDTIGMELPILNLNGCHVKIYIK